MKRLLVLIIVLLAFSAPALAPVLAQTSTVNPAAYLPADLPIYLQVRTDAAGLNTLSQLSALSTRMINVVNLPINLSIPAVLPQGFDVTTDILPWLGDQIGIAILDTPFTFSDAIFVLPIRDAVAAQAFVSKVAARAAVQSVGVVSIYKTDSLGLAVAPGIIWLSTPQGIDNLLGKPMLVRLSDDPAYQQVQAALPADAAITGYLSGSYVTGAFSALSGYTSPTLSTIVQAAFRLHPAQSAAEDALLASPKVNGVGFTLQLTDNRLDATAVLSLNAQYPAPTLTTATAGTALLNLIPSTSFAVFDSYDLAAGAIPLAAVTYINSTPIGSTFASVTQSLGGTPAPTPTPSPTPTATPSVTADSLIVQAQPLLAQAESTMGMSLDQLYSLIDGEYAVAVFPDPGPTVGTALYLQSSDPQRLIDTIEHVSHLILTDPTTGQQLFTAEHSTVDGTDVAFISQQGVSGRLALGIVNSNILFVTQESTAAQVVDAANHPSASSPALTWRDAVGAGQEALFYVDPRMIDLYSLGHERSPALPLTALAGALDVRDNGLFVFRLAAVISS